MHIAKTTRPGYTQFGKSLGEEGFYLINDVYLDPQIYLFLQHFSVDCGNQIKNSFLQYIEIQWVLYPFVPFSFRSILSAVCCSPCVVFLYYFECIPE